MVMTMRSRDSWTNSAEPTFATPRSANRPTRGVQVAKVAKALGRPLMRWQQMVADVAGEVLPNGLPAFREVVVSVERQQGKTTWTLAEKVERCTLRGEPFRVAYTAQTGSDARKKLLEDELPILEGSPLGKAVAGVKRAGGSESIRFRNGSRIDVLASTHSAGHGRIIDLGIVDEAFDDVDDRREQSLIPAMMTRPAAQLYVVSTMGTDASVYLNRKVDVGRAAALEGRTSGVAYFEWSIPLDADVDDPAEWWAHMPAMGVTISEASVAHARMTMSDGEFRRAFGNQRMRSAEMLIPEVTWRAVCSSGVSPRDPLTFAVDVAPDRDWAAVVACGIGAEGLPVVELIDYRPGVGWVEDRCRQLVADHQGSLVVEARSPASALALRVDTEMSGVEAVAASSAFYDAVADGQVRVRTDARFDSALVAAGRQVVGESWRIGRRTGKDVTPLVAATLAFAASSRVTFPAIF